MPRKARTQSKSGIYHVMVRGINRQNIFEDDEDRNKYLEILRICKDLSAFELPAFCLMSNHVHLLIKVGDEPLELIMKRLGSRYVQWFNQKYDRTGHLFQDRFKSENVETDQYFLTVLRYILQDPMKAGLEKEPGTYPWSSFRAYCEGRGSLTDTEYASGQFASVESLIAFLRERNADQAMDTGEDEKALSDVEAHQLMQAVTECDSATTFQKMGSSKQRYFIQELLNRGLTPAQIVRLTGKSSAMVYRCRAAMIR